MFIDGYNRSASDIAGCIHTRINEGNYWFVIEMKNEAKIKIIGKWSPSSICNGNVYSTDGVSPTLVNHTGCEPRIRVGAIRGRGERNRQTLEVKDEMVTNTLTSVQKDNILIFDFPICLNSKVDEKQPSIEHRIYSDEGCATAVTTSFMPSVSTDFRIRKLTERECFRLMGVREDDIDKLLKAGISKTQLYKLAGNSIVCDVLVAIFDKLLVHTEPQIGQQLRIF
jgi:DNA (cytosine-5)-methyltransferase 1